MNYNPVEWDAPKNIQAFYTDALCGDFSIKSAEGQANWQRFTQHFHLPQPKPTIQQVHGKMVVEAPQGYQSSADAIFTYQDKTPCSVVTADCVPILLCDKKGKWVAAIHAGWNGLVQQILYHCCQKLPHYQDAIAWIGPCICQQHYEIGEDVRQRFDALPIECDPYMKFFCASLPSKQAQKVLLDLSGIAEAQLKHLGISAIFRNNRCTYGDKNLYSFRQNSETGRIANIIWKN